MGRELTIKDVAEFLDRWLLVACSTTAKGKSKRLSYNPATLRYKVEYSDDSKHGVDKLLFGNHCEVYLDVIRAIEDYNQYHV